MTRWLTGSLRETPAAVPALAAVVLFVVWDTSQAGYPLTHWAPGGLIVLALLAIAVGAVPLRFAEIPVTVKLAVVCLAAFTALSFLSILWAAVPGDAWVGANRTLLYLMVFALFALWRGRGASAALLVGAWTLAMIGLAVFALLHLDAAGTGALARLLPDGRLIYPSGYANSNAAQWMMAFWPSLLLARETRLPWGLRGMLAGGCVLLAEVALLSQSRGSLYATPVVLLLAFVLFAGRVRLFAVLVPVAAGIGAAAPAVLRVGDRLQNGGNAPAAIHEATVVTFAAALLVGLVVASGALLESRRELSQVAAARVHRGVGALAVCTLLAVLVVGWVAAGDPLARIHHGWETFKGGYAADSSTGNRLVSGLGSERYDFYRVALDEFAAHPLLGIGVDNFQQQYLRLGRSGETPRYPHSVELRTLAQTGLLGALLAVVGLGAALAAGRRAMRHADPLGRTAAAAALGGFAYWTVHGSFDWFWEFAGLGAPAFALLGIACSLEPRVPLTGSERARPPRPGRRWTLAAVGLAAALAALLSLAAPWLSERQIQSAASIWPKAPLAAYARLNDAARLNPLSDRAYLVAGSIALRFGDLIRAKHEFSLALWRVPDDSYATLELGAIASEVGEHARALELLQRAVHLDPRDPLAREALQTVRSGGRIGVEKLNRSILLKAERLA
jgi:tetratricopeptide (TPR) repeat protein